MFKVSFRNVYKIRNFKSYSCKNHVSIPFNSVLDPSDGPWLDQDKPELNVTIKYFVNRPMFYNESIVIKSHNKILYRGR